MARPGGAGSLEITSTDSPQVKSRLPRGNHSFRMCSFGPSSHRVFTDSSLFSPQDVPELLPENGGEAVDVGGTVASKRVRFIMCLLFCQGVQAFMSYDGGATPAAMGELRKDTDGTENEFTVAEEGLLGSMDKFGIVLTSMFWGMMLQICKPKLMLAIGIFLNLAATFLFGTMRNKNCMFAMKLVMGGTQSLQGVWGTVWTMLMAPPESRTTWLGLGAISAGIGNGLGTIVAGFGTAHGMGYAFAFEMQAVVLFFLWVLLLCTPHRLFDITLPILAPSLTASSIAPDSAPAPGSYRDGRKELLGWSSSALSSPASQQPSPWRRRPSPEPVAERQCGRRDQLMALWQNGVYVTTTMWIGLIMFQGAAIQFYWFQVFTAQNTWAIDSQFCTTMFLLINLVFSGLGVSFGPVFFDSLGGYSTAVGVVRTLLAMRRLSYWAVILGPLGVLCIVGKVLAGTDLSAFWADQGLANLGDPWLWTLWLCIGGIYAAHNGCVAVCCGINVEVIPASQRSFSSSVEMTFRNIFGYAFGPLLPGLLVSIAGDVMNLKTKGTEESAILNYFGFSMILLMNVATAWIASRALAAASMRLGEVRHDSVDDRGDGLGCVKGARSSEYAA